jgi:hypothetical protein
MKGNPYLHRPFGLLVLQLLAMKRLPLPDFAFVLSQRERAAPERLRMRLLLAIGPLVGRCPSRAS